MTSSRAFHAGWGTAWSGSCSIEWFSILIVQPLNRLLPYQISLFCFLWTCSFVISLYSSSCKHKLKLVEVNTLKMLSSPFLIQHTHSLYKSAHVTDTAWRPHTMRWCHPLIIYCYFSLSYRSIDWFTV